MRNILVLLTLAISLNGFADSLEQQKIRAFGTTQLPAQIKIIDFKGVEQIYDTRGITDSKFILDNENYFSMGQATKCDPVLGTTADNMNLSLMVKQRVTYGNEDMNTGTTPIVSTGPTGKAILHIPKGSAVAGRCHNGTKTLTAMTIYPFDVDKNVNVYDRKFPLTWEK